MDINELKTDDNIKELINNNLETTANVSISDEIQLNDKVAALYKLPSGRALTKNETYSITSAEDTKIILLIGPSASGKTTIETTLYQMFQRSGVGDYFFAGSNTLHGYEQRSYYTRMKSNQSTSSTPRTSRGVQETFLHLKTWNYKTNYFQNFLFGDLSGEDFQSHIADINAMQKDFSFIKSVDYLVAVLDGKLISDKKNRNGTFEELAQLLRTICDAGLITNHTKIQVALSKYDIVIENKTSTEAFIARIKSELQQRLKKYCKEIDFYYIAAMPDGNVKMEIGYGIEELLNSWGTKKTYKVSFDDNKKIDVKSEFNKHYKKLLGEHL